MVSLFTCDSTTQSCQCVYGVIVYLWQHYPVLPVCVWCHCYLWQHYPVLPVCVWCHCYLWQHYPVLPVYVWCHCLPVTALPSPASVCMVSLFTCDSTTNPASVYMVSLFTCDSTTQSCQLVYLWQCHSVLPMCVWCYCLPVTVLPSPTSVFMVLLFYLCQSYQSVCGVTVYL